MLRQPRRRPGGQAVTPAHIAGIPVEETALSFGPVLLTAAGIATLKMRER
jgi:hypothetical protein